MNSGEKSAIEAIIGVSNQGYQKLDEMRKQQDIPPEVLEQFFSPDDPELADIEFQITIRKLPLNNEELQKEKDRATIDLGKYVIQQVPGLLNELVESPPQP